MNRVNCVWHASIPFGVWLMVSTPVFDGVAEPVFVEVESEASKILTTKFTVGDGSEQENTAVYSYPSTSPNIVTPEYAALQSKRYPTLADFVLDMKTALASKMPFDSENYDSQSVIHIQQSKTHPQVIYQQCCELDDSIAGDQLIFLMDQQPQGWVLKAVTHATLCYRAVVSDMCL